MSDHLIHRAALLLQQKKNKEAEALLMTLFAQSPTNIPVIGLLCEIRIMQNQYEEALNLMNNAIGINPSLPQLFFTRSRIYIYQQRYNEAEVDLLQAIMYNPREPEYFSLWAFLKNERKDYKGSLELADKALEINPQHIPSLNARSTALLKLNRKEESFDTIEGALREAPDNAYTHTNYGWGLLEKGSHEKAMTHFAEALRSNPASESAQLGMKQSLKARYWFYRTFLRFAFWLNNMQAKFQWAFIIGLYLVYRILGYLASKNPELQPFIYPVIAVLAILAFSTWIITPVSNLFLRFNKYGRYLLSKEEIISSNFVGVSAVVAIVSAIVYVFTFEVPWLALSIFGITMMVPLGVMFSSEKNKWKLIGYSSVMAVLGLTGVFITFLKGNIFNAASVMYFIGFIAFQWIMNILLIRENNK